jgi:site-specific recombinase XerD
MSTELSASLGQLLTAALAPAAQGKYIEAALQGSDNTKRSYQSNLKAFIAYCTEHNLVALPADVATLSHYITHLADDGRKFSTIKHHLAAIHKLHQLNGYQSAINANQIELLLKGIARLKGKRQKQAPAFTRDELREAINRLDLATPVGLRDRALLLLGFFGAFRRSELRSLDLEQLKFSREHLIIELGKSKTNQFAEAETKAVFYSSDYRYCPIRAVEDWMAQLGRTTGPLFVSLRRVPGQAAVASSSRLSEVSINEIVKEHLGLLHTGKLCTAHSLRVSFVTINVAAGKSNKAIRTQTGQKSDKMIDLYTRINDVTTLNAAQNMGF